MVVVFLHGPAASGKHTVGSQLGALTGLPLFHNHLTVDLVRSLFEFGSDSFARLRAIIWLESFAEAAEQGRSFIFTFTPEATVDSALIGQMVDVVDAAGGKVLFVELTCPRELQLQRLGAESRRRFGKLTSAVLYAQIEQQGGFEFAPLPPPLLQIDTGEHSAEEAAALIAAALPEE
jgi:hypothetical protein